MDTTPRFDVIVLGPVTDALPDYCVHGKATCVLCGTWVWLGNASYKTVTETTTLPICMPCAESHIPAGTRPDHNVRDHKRADGPHT